MKLRNLLVIALVATAFASCKDDDPMPEVNVVTFEESYWSSLIDSPQYMGPLLYGDGTYNWEDANTTLSPTELINPQSAVSGSTPVLRRTKHWYLPLDKHQQWLEPWITEEHKEWRPNVMGQCKSWFDIGLQPRAVSRDLIRVNPDFLCNFPEFILIRFLYQHLSTDKASYHLFFLIPQQFSSLIPHLTLCLFLTLSHFLTPCLFLTLSHFATHFAYFV